ncbi:MAG: molybdenum cofactor guanylyltransferase [Streptosporangiaceae bacterium]
MSFQRASLRRGAPPYDAVLLAGGQARRMGGVDKPLLNVGGRTLLERTAEAVGDAEHLVVVGPPRLALPAARVVRESPPGAGPVAALGAGLAHVTGVWVAVLAADLPFLSADAVRALRVHAGQGDGAVLVDGEGDEQWLVGVWRTVSLRRALQGYTGTSMRGLLGPMRPARVSAAGQRSRPPPWLDCDTMEDIANAREWM